jgi:hypothetical protein
MTLSKPSWRPPIPTASAYPATRGAGPLMSLIDNRDPDLAIVAS